MELDKRFSELTIIDKAEKKSHLICYVCTEQIEAKLNKLSIIKHV
jgi:uncharacterized protein YlbG (UPF0298 family)